MGTSLETSAIAEHAWKYGHPIEWSDTQVVDRVSRHKELHVKEALHIRVRDKYTLASTEMGDWKAKIVGLKQLGGMNKGANADD